MTTIIPPNPLTTARETAGLSIPELAKQSGVKKKRIEELEAGHALPHPKTVARLIPVLGERMKHLEMALLDWPGFNPPWFAGQDAQAQRTAAQLEELLDDIERGLQCSDGDEPELKELTTSLITEAGKMLRLWHQAVEANDRARALMLLEAAEGLGYTAWDLAQFCCNPIDLLRSSADNSGGKAS
jgi:transcriptional regulator with XRE-family HTH domain